MISASLVKDLREKTGAGMMDCKKALLETNGDFEAAIDWLRTKGLAAAAKKAERIAAEGLAAAVVVGNTGAVVEVNSETDFVGRNEKFQHLVKAIGELAVQCDNLESLKVASMPSGKSVADEIIENISTIGENINLRRMNVVKVQDGVVASYVHNSVVEGLGKIAVIVGLESKAADKTKLKALGKQIAMHIAALKPQALNQSDLDPALIQRERDIFFEQSRASGKPDNIIEKMIEGRIRKFFEEVVLVDQVFVIDGKLKISEVLANAAKDLGAELTITNFVRYEVGEGIEQEDKNFADEVAAVMK
ncbi:translation elongation factor Ts [Candidatus Trichorickettsia mobilis]|uniref:translation elongation factor Ts n=1 Tax=Candidatus Trichorickettsia mobilis TaxID=1346319 RepID=UPI00292F092F|nr:translation elongation factor Ts [Candidatus Trichorickettsia mobilis]